MPRDRIHSSTGIILRTPVSVLFVIPWGRHWIIGTTDTDWSLDKAHPAASRTDIDYVLGQVNKVLAVPLTRDDVEGVYAGLRPLLAGESESTSKLSREHTVAHPVPGLVLIAGGKYTTYRVMARDAVDAVAHGLDGKVAPSCTDSVPLAGADGYIALWNSRHALARSSGLHVARIEHLLHRYGSMIGEVLALIAADPGLGQAAGRRRRLPARRGRLRCLARGRPAPGRRTGPPHSCLDRDLGPRPVRGRGGSQPDGRADAVEVPPDRQGAGELPGPGGRRARLPGGRHRHRTPTRSASARPDIVPVMHGDTVIA